MAPRLGTAAGSVDGPGGVRRVQGQSATEVNFSLRSLAIVRTLSYSVFTEGDFHDLRRLLTSLD